MFELSNDLLAPENVPYDFIPEEMVLDKKAALNDYALLFLPPAPYMSENFSRELARWVKAGGTLIALGPFALNNEYGLALPRVDSLFQTTFPLYTRLGNGEWNYSLDDGGKPVEAMLKTTEVGAGRLIFLTRSLEVYLRNPELKKQLLAVLRQYAVKPADAAVADLKIRLRDGAGGVKYLCLCNQNALERATGEVQVKGTFKTALDLLAPPAGAPVPVKSHNGQTAVPVSLAPGEWTIISLQ
jgi:hypothetical protein